MKNWREWDIQIIPLDRYPDCLRTISKPPTRLYCRGEWRSEVFENTITMVGSRKMTRYGEIIVEKLVPTIVSRRITIISGFMYGVDTKCHRECIDCGGVTLAVVGGGLNVLAPPSNDELYTQILNTGGLVISEYEPDFKPTVWSFPQRDRIMSALATMGVLVIEGGIKSGSLITAEHALKQGRKVMAVPGPVNSLVSEGTNWLIKSGAAKMITGVEDIFEDIRPEQQCTLFKDYSDLLPAEKMIIGVLERECMTIDELSVTLDLSVPEVSRTISLMLMRDLVEEDGGKIYLS